ncbi:hypothetical protein [Stutzerimonas chloritidismutans]|uniref:hypothetical protein n=1 Tax=Stutzerimonas chloritidismutans TaxID=203192 RepID=UPI003F174F22
MIESEIPPPKPADFSATSLDFQMGAPVAVLERLLITSSDDWEDFTLELVHYLKKQYLKVTKCGGVDRWQEKTSLRKGLSRYRLFVVCHWAHAAPCAIGPTPWPCSS